MFNVSVIGGGAFGTAIASLISENITKNKMFDSRLVLWANPEQVNGVEISEAINKTKENTKYLPGIIIPSCVVCTSDIQQAVKAADILVLAIPSAYLKNVCLEIKKWITKKVAVLSLTKGFVLDRERLLLASQIIEESIGLRVSSLSGANIALDIAKKNYCRSTLSYSDDQSKAIFENLLNTSSFKVECVQNKIEVELCGALKNIVAVGYGIGLRLNMPPASLAELMRTGVCELRLYLKEIHGIENDNIFFSSCGFADILVTCLSGRNSRFGQTWSGTSTPDKALQGPETASQVFHLLCAKGLKEKFPFFINIHCFCSMKISPIEFIRSIQEEGKS